MKDALADAGRDASDLRVVGYLPLVKRGDGTLDVERTMDAVPDLSAAGLTDLRARFTLPDDGSAALDELRDIVRAFRVAASRSGAPRRRSRRPVRAPTTWIASRNERTLTERMGSMDGALEGRRAIVVGGGSGIGLSSARLLARDGATVTIAGRTEKKLKDASSELDAEGLAVGYAVCDALDASAVRDAVDTASDDQHQLDIAVVVPGGGAIKPVLLFGDDEFSQQVDANLRPVYLVLKYAGQAMVRNRSGSFVAISSTAAVFSARYLASYSAGKAAVDQLVRVAANELGEFNIRVNSVQPGMTRTPATEAAFKNADMMAAFLAEQPIRRHGEVDDIAQAVRYFAGPESSWVTGQLLAVDGGHTLRAFVDYQQLIPLPDNRGAIQDAGA
jgi:NAD(P)-dependent dehydrogenase (short-subunit alcohol dehydrogenase family)